MAIFVSRDGNFQIDRIEFTPNVITMGEETQFEIDIKNISGKNITKLIVEMDLRFKGKDGAIHSSDSVAVFGKLPLETSLGYWNNGKAVTFKGTFKLSSFYEMDNSFRVVQACDGADAGYDSGESVGLVLGIKTDVFFANMRNSDQFLNLRGPNSEYLTVLDARYKPTIPVFAADRVTNRKLDDEGESLLASIRLSKADAAVSDRMSLVMTSGLGRVDVSELIDAASAEKTQADVQGVFGKNFDWPLTLWFGDEYESASVSVTVPRAFANMHLSGAVNGGVCFGGFSQSTDEKPLFQCYYPATFYNGIDGISRYSTNEVVVGSRWIDGKRIYRRVFEGNVAAGGTKTFDAIPSMETVVGINGMMKWTTSGAWVPLVYSEGNTTYNTASADAEGRVSVTCTNAATCFVIVEYTKTGEKEEID